MTSVPSSTGGPYGLRDIRSLYPAVTDKHLRYLEKWGLVRQSSVPRDRREYSFSDLLTIKQVSAELERGTPLRMVLRSLIAERQGQLELDFLTGHIAQDAPRAKVVTLAPRKPLQNTATPAPLHASANLSHPFADPQAALAAKYFLEGSRLDDGDERKMEEAAAAYRKALVVDPDLVPAIVNLANIHYARDEMIEAQALYERAIGLDPDCFEAHFNLGNILHDLGRLDEARECFRRVLEARPDHPDVLLGLGRVEFQDGNYAGAAQHYQDALALQPDFPEAWLNLGLTHREEDRPEQALECYARALELRPAYRNALLASAAMFENQSRRSEALGMYERLIALQPDDPPVLNAMAVALAALGRHAEAVRHLERALELDPAFADAQYNLGFVHQGRNEYEAAVACYDAVLRMDGAHAEAAWGRAISLLGMGDFRRGWQEYEVRHAARLSKIGPIRPRFAQPMWAGQSLAGKTILLNGEQGAGDQIQFIRYARVLAQRGAVVHVLTDPRLERLLASAPGVARAMRELPSDEIAAYDTWSFLLSVPYRVGTLVDTVPAQTPYLTPPEPAVQRWARRLQTLSAGQPKIGLAWHSGPARHVWMEYRSMPLEALRPLMEVPDVSFVSVQFGSQAADAFPGLDVGGEIGDFADHAALLASLDLLITVDTVTAHLGGALGIPTWLLLPTCADWRWMRSRVDSPWYPSMVVFRQTRLGDWEPVVAQAAEKLRSLAVR